VSGGCLGCGGQELRLLYHLPEKGDAHIVVCNACDLVQLEELPNAEALHELYADGYFEGVGSDAGYEEYANQEKEYLATFDDDVNRIRDFVAHGSVLDIGCGYGYFVRQALSAGFDAYGVDLSPDGIREAEKHVPGRVYRGTLDDVDALTDRQFDVIFASHLIEHIPEPKAFVEGLIPRLKDRGIVMFVTPNIESWLARVSGRRWVSFKIPEHVAYYTPATISHLLESAGLEIVAIDPAYQYYRLPFLMSKIRELIHPIGRIVPGFERWAVARDRMLRVTSGSLRVIARRRSDAESLPGSSPARC
jgi:2-polyprenyl-3-methyl-5-hydroxy-6-metoxy-1,4-benzoquinol methylase